MSKETGLVQWEIEHRKHISINTSPIHKRAKNIVAWNSTFTFFLKKRTQIKITIHTAVGGLIRSVPTIILSVTFPPEWNAFVIFTHKLEKKKTLINIHYDRER